MTVAFDHMRRAGTESGQCTVRILQMRFEAEGVVSIDLAPVDHALVPWTPGAHIDLVLPSGTVRQYSLCNGPQDGVYRVAVLRQDQGRGGSREVHDILRVGQVLTISPPRNAFELVPSARYVFVAGGIGITPILPMIAAAERAGADWRLVYGGRRQASMAFTAELAGYGNRQVDLRTDDGAGPIDVAQLVQQSDGAKIFACGPLGLLDALEAAFDAAGRSDDLHLERFSAAIKPLPGDGTFRVNLSRSGGHVDVPPGQSILEALRAAGVDAPCSCEQGFCGTCETRVLAGEPDHRDDLLTEAERARGDVMMPCVSRSKTPELTLDL